MTLPIRRRTPGCCNPNCTDCYPRSTVSRRKALEGAAVLGFLAVGALAKDDKIAGVRAQAAQPAPDRPQPAQTPAATPPRPVTAKDLLAHPRLTLTDIARVDLERDAVDARLLHLLGELLRHWQLTVGCFKTGHSKFVAGSRSVSQHYYGQAADIGVVNGHPVTHRNRAALEIVNALVSRPTTVRPTEIGHPFSLKANRLQGVWTDRAHRDHLHLGIRGMGDR